METQTERVCVCERESERERESFDCEKEVTGDNNGL